jgi:hypothetical protein
VDELWEKMHVETSAGKNALMSQSASVSNCGFLPSFLPSLLSLSRPIDPPASETLR